MFPNDWRWNTGTSSIRNRLAVAWIGASSSKGGLFPAMTVHGVTCIKLTGTMGTSEPHSLGKAMLYTWSHNARNPTQSPAVHWRISWQAGHLIMQGLNGQQKFKNKRHTKNNAVWTGAWEVRKRLQKLQVDNPHSLMPGALHYMHDMVYHGSKLTI